MTMMSRQILSLAVFLSLAGIAFAQNGSITGTVKASKGGVIPGAAVTVSETSLGVHQTAQTNGVGFFAFSELPPGTYTVTVEDQ